ncbi:glutamyl-tRNA reductase [Marinilabiliaceae bacterium ANBcel2]|nr:glutamyl-tRNA reductase [Marinilabiliaceae bacterium ANBcel2]
MIGVVGLSHKSAPVEVREKFAFDREDVLSVSKRVLLSEYINEVFILSTCNRTEIYFKSEGICTAGVFKTIVSSLPHYKLYGEEVNDSFYRYFNKEAVRHLFRVVCGLEAMVVGEYQIVAQLKEACYIAQSAGTVSTVLERLYGKALETGKLVRSTTDISKGVFSVSSAAVAKCCQVFDNIVNRKILLIGAGDTGELVIKNLHKKGCQNIFITNRTAGKADELSKKYNGTAVAFESYLDELSDSEIVVTSVTSKEPVLDYHNVKSSLNGLSKILMIDLGVPRNINPDITNIESVNLFNIDDLNGIVDNNREKKLSCFAESEKIIEEKVSEFTDWLYMRNLSPAIDNIINAIDKVAVNELLHYKNPVKSSNKEPDAVVEYSEIFSKKIKNELIKNLKSVTDNGRKSDYIQVINNLFSKINET